MSALGAGHPSMAAPTNSCLTVSVKDRRVSVLIVPFSAPQGAERWAPPFWSRVMVRIAQKRFHAIGPPPETRLQEATGSGARFTANWTAAIRL